MPDKTKQKRDHRTKPPKKMREIWMQMAEAKQNLPHLSELVEYFIQYAGGPKAVAKMLWDETTRAEPGSLVRQRNLGLIASLWRASNKDEGHADELGLLSEEDLDRRLQSYVAVAQEKEEDVPDEGTSGPTPAAPPEAQAGDIAAAQTGEEGTIAAQHLGAGPA